MAVAAIDIESGPKCGGKVRVIACIEEPALIRKILDHVRQPAGMANTEARGPPGVRPVGDVCDDWDAGQGVGSTRVAQGPNSGAARSGEMCDR